MSSVRQLEVAVKQLNDAERAAFRAWYADFDAQDWDRQIDDDVKAGRLDWLVQEAREDLGGARCLDR